MLKNSSNEVTRFIPTPLAGCKKVKSVGNDFKSFDYRRNAADVNNVEETPVLNEMEPSTANIIVGKLDTVGNDFKSLDNRSLREE